MIEFTLTRTSTASIEAVFDAMTDHRGIADYMWACRRSTLDREGTPAPNGVGAIRRLVAIGPPFVEEIIAYERPTRYAYKMLSGAPTRDHVGTIELREAGTGTEISWQLRSTLKIPGVDRLMLPVFKRSSTSSSKAASPPPSAAPEHDVPSYRRSSHGATGHGIPQRPAPAQQRTLR